MKSSSNKINIPKHIFEKYYFKNGGEADLEFAGAIQREMKGEVNAELEGGEYIVDSQGLRRVEGPSHEKGGVDLALEEGTLILSDHLKLGKELAKSFSKEYGVKVKAKDSYATALDRLVSKIGLEKINKEHAKLIGKVEEQKKVKDENTQSKNMEYLSQELHEIEKGKEPVEMAAISVFNELFKDQEKQKGNYTETQKEVFQDGGLIPLSQQMTPEQVDRNMYKLISSDMYGRLVLEARGTGDRYITQGTERVGAGGSWNLEVPKVELQPMSSGEVPTITPLDQPMNVSEVDPNMYKIVSENSNGALVLQGIGDGKMYRTPATSDGTLPQVGPATVQISDAELGITPTTATTETRSRYDVPPVVYGNRVANKYEASAYAYQRQGEVGYGGIDKNSAGEEIKNLFPTLYNEHFEGSTPRDSKEFQQSLQRYYYNVLDNAKILYGADSEKYKQLEAQIQQDMFTDEGTDSSIRSFDGKFGDYTATRPNYTLELLPEDIYKEVKENGVNTLGQLREYNPEYYEKYVSGRGLSAHDDVWLGSVTGSEETEGGSQGASTDNTSSDETTKTPVTERRNNMGIRLTPDLSQLPPSAQQAHLKTNRRYQRADFVGIDPQAQLNQLAVLTGRAQDSLESLPAHQRAALSANMLATQGQQASNIIQQTSQYNNQLFNQIQNQNSRIQMAEENASAQDALNYEQRQFLAQAKTDNDFRNYFNAAMVQNHQNFRDIETTNKINHLYNDFQLTDRGYESFGKGPRFSFGNITLTKEQEEQINKIINKKKFGGRFGG